MKFKYFALTVLLTVLIVSAQAIELLRLQNKLFILENYQIANFTGPGVSSYMVSNYIKLINNAYQFYGKDINKSTNYISQQLESSYGYAYSIVILQSNQTIGSLYLYCVGGDTIVTWTKVNSYQPNWAYIIWPISKATSNLTTNYITSLGKGIGIDGSKENIIRNVVKAYQTSSKCGHQITDMSTMSKSLEQLDNQRWSIVCKKYSSINYNSLLKSNNNQYIQLAVNTNKCEYMLLAL